MYINTDKPPRGSRNRYLTYANASWLSAWLAIKGLELRRLFFFAKKIIINVFITNLRRKKFSKHLKTNELFLKADDERALPGNEKRSFENMRRRMGVE